MSENSQVTKRWQAHPVLAAAVRVVAVVTPACVALGFSLLASAVVHPPADSGARVLWWIAISVLSLGVLFAVQRLARRLLPLAALLKLSLVFPDQAPGRYRLARQVGRPRDLEKLLARARAAGHEGAEALAPQTVLELVAALSVHDRATRGHSERVRIFADMIAGELRLPQHDQDRLRWAALLHDVGKLSVSASVLRKPRAPSAVEWAALKQHPTHGSRLISSIAPWLGQWALAVDHHHERFDGTGYPHGLRGQDISLGGRIVAVADAYETMTAARPYKRPLSPRAARQQLVDCSGAQFDPVIVRMFLNISLGRLWRTIGVSAWISQVPLLPQLSSGLSAATVQTVPMAARSAAGLVFVASAAAAVPAAASSTPAAHAPASGPPVSASVDTPPAGDGLFDSAQIDRPAPRETQHDGKADAKPPNDDGKPAHDDTKSTKSDDKPPANAGGPATPPAHAHGAPADGSPASETAGPTPSAPAAPGSVSPAPRADTGPPTSTSSHSNVPTPAPSGSKPTAS